MSDISIALYSTVNLGILTRETNKIMFHQAFVNVGGVCLRLADLFQPVFARLT